MQTNLAKQFRYTAVKEKMMKVIYDIGANNGDDIAYYLEKADKVVAIEANPILAGEIAKRYHSEILTSRLFVENVVLTAEDESAFSPFYIHRLHHVLSQFPKPVRPEEFY
jgi:FkbM family methyltransferase